MGIVKKINITSQSGENTFYVADAYLESGMGIVGDRSLELTGPKRYVYQIPRLNHKICLNLELN